MRSHRSSLCRTNRKVALLRASTIVRKIHRLRAIESGLLSPAPGAQPWANTRAMTDSNPLSAWDIIDLNLWEQREFAGEKALR